MRSLAVAVERTVLATKKYKELLSDEETDVDAYLKAKHVASVSGQSGIGKSRIMRELFKFLITAR